MKDILTKVREYVELWRGDAIREEMCYQSDVKIPHYILDRHIDKMPHTELLRIIEEVFDE